MRALAGGAATLLVVIGAGGAVAPKVSAGQFGIPAADPAALAFVRATGMRDVVLGAIVFASLADAKALRRVLGWTSLVGLADALTLASVRGLRPQHAVHLGGFAALALLALAMDA